MDKEYKYVAEKPKYETTFSDSFKCYTAWTPSWNPDRTLASIVIPNKNDPRPAFRYNGFDTIMWYSKEMYDGNLGHNNKVGGYTDFKWMFFGNNENAPISLKAQVQEEGYIFICESSAW